MEMRAIHDLLAVHPFFADLGDDDICFIAGCGANLWLRAGHLLFSEGDPANTLYVIQHGELAIETHVPGQRGIVIDTVGAGGLVGWSWLFPPYRWHFDARVVEDLTAIDDTEEAESGVGDAEAGGEVTQPGTSLAIGEPATIPIEYSDNQGLASMTVVGIEEGDLAAMADFDLDDGVEGNVPYYVTFSMTKVSGGELSGAGPESEAGGLLDDGTPAQELSLIGSFEPCDTQYAGEEFDAGETYESCRVYMAPEGNAVTSVEYHGDYGGDYYETPIIWAP